MNHDEDPARDDEDAQVYAAPFEGESLAEHEQDEAVAATQEAVEAERDEIDAERSLVDRIGDYAVQDDPNVKLREELDGDLAWWAEKDIAPLDIASDMANGVCGYLKHLRELARHGLSLDAMPATVTFTNLTGPIVMAALQVLGTLHPHLRDDITDLIREINTATPVATSEEAEAYKQASTALHREQVADARKQFEEAGIPVIPIEDFLGGASPEDQDASLN